MNQKARTKKFETLANEYSDDLYRFAVWLCKDPTLARDLVQETFLRAWRAIDRLRDDKAAKGWLLVILRREFARTFERKVPEIRDLDDYVIAADDAMEPENRAEKRMLRQGMMSLEPKYREPLLLQVIGGFSCKEIADELGISRSAVMTQLFRARHKLKAVLDADDSEQHENVHELS